MIFFAALVACFYVGLTGFGEGNALVGFIGLAGVLAVYMVRIVERVKGIKQEVEK